MVTSKLVMKCSLCAVRLIMVLVLDFGSVRIWIYQDLDLSGFGSLRIRISLYTWGNIHPRYSLIGDVIIPEMDVANGINLSGGD
jgi:hypothetical protein